MVVACQYIGESIGSVGVAEVGLGKSVLVAGSPHSFQLPNLLTSVANLQSLIRPTLLAGRAGLAIKPTGRVMDEKENSGKSSRERLAETVWILDIWVDVIDPRTTAGPIKT